VPNQSLKQPLVLFLDGRHLVAHLSVLPLQVVHPVPVALGPVLLQSLSSLKDLLSLLLAGSQLALQ
jgi:hypothetical protein